MEPDTWGDRVQELLALEAAHKYDGPLACMYVPASQAICGDDFQYMEPDGLPDNVSLPGTVEDLAEVDAPECDVLLHCQVLARLEVTDTVVVYCGQESHTECPSVELSHLPPLRLSVWLPPGYPGRLLPEVELGSTWLDTAQTDALEDQLSVIAEGLAGCPAIFEMVEWLKENALDNIGVNGGRLWLNLAHDRRASAASSSQSPDEAAQLEEDLLMQLYKYNITRQVEVFRSGIWTCGICFEEVPGVHCVRLPACSHYYCLQCMRQHAHVKVRDGELGSLVCPMPGCGRQLALQVLKDLLTAEDWARWESLTLSRTLDCMTDLVYCPKCRAPCLEDERDHCAQCPECLFVFCGLCMDAWHTGSDCIDPDAKMATLKKRRERAIRGGGLEDSEEALKALNELKSLKEMKAISKRCPTCRMGIQKNGGCNKMSCSNCGTRFCWKCNQQVRGYDHFSESSCVLFDQQEINEWNAMMNGNGNQALLRGNQQDGFNLWDFEDVEPQQVSPCPQCRQLNAKMNNNNHMGCWACGAHYCYLCRRVLGGGSKDRSGGRHFSNIKGCKQHTPD